MSTEKITGDKIREIMCLSIYDLLNNEDFHQFYTGTGKNSLTAHICGDVGCPTKEEILKLIEKECSNIIRAAKEIAYGITNG